MVQVTLQPAHGSIILLGVGGVIVGLWAGFRVGAARKKYNIKLPQMYAEQSDKNATAFNCIQRAHQNVLENLPGYYILLLSSSIFRPKVAAAVGLIRLVGFVVYVIGYSSGDPEKRRKGSFGYICGLISVGLAIEAGYRILQG